MTPPIPLWSFSENSSDLVPPSFPKQEPFYHLKWVKQLKKRLHRLSKFTLALFVMSLSLRSWFEFNNASITAMNVTKDWGRGSGVRWHLMMIMRWMVTKRPYDNLWTNNVLDLECEYVSCKKSEFFFSILLPDIGLIERVRGNLSGWGKSGNRIVRLESQRWLPEINNCNNELCV